ncbi:NACHT domain-containing NTPase [Limnothrix sp. FACHB-1083]|uniref:NACHT domain-containing protein n=1 Tax=unclassified Limnothrix TaxID=2632864 RepID=UPI0016814DCD|nr:MULTISPECIES: NACHT domain-containing protein [unclassified Limnothrix]MBD2159399.1 NACHT domain-containing NTPase [Limnothrix sp. FACHB-1083]MBD2193104.1 NACHT domain-containing NTPase [Limnothrix sp. FACHB-1088]
MARNERSLKATPAGCQKLTEALKNSRYNKSKIGDFVQYRKRDGKDDQGVSRATIAKAFKGEPVDRGIFIGLCDLLGLSWQEVAELATSEPPAPSVASDAIDVAWVRRKLDPYLRRKNIKPLTTSSPIPLDEIYVQVDVLEKLTANRRLSSSELLRSGKAPENRISSLEAVKKHKALIVWGKPGAGKSTFLKHLVTACLDEEILSDHIPIFLELKTWTESPGQPNFLDFIARQWSDWGIANSDIVLNQLLKSGKILVLLDGLDEVLEAHTNRAIREIESWVERFPEIHIVATCRIAAKEYIFEDFTEVEIADFSNSQIQQFVINWFEHHQDLSKANQFLENLRSNQSILELSSNPLLLTLLCLIFIESGNFPTNRAKLYEEGVDLLLKKWDLKRKIQRDQVYKNLSVDRKKNLLSRLALATFQEGAYFFDQGVAEEWITKYIHDLPDAKYDPEISQLDGEAVLRSIVAQHGLLVEQSCGIYAFSHLTFHEYFAAQAIAASQDWKILARNLLEKNWREVILLIANSIQQGDELLLTLKQRTDNLLADDPKLQAVLAWATEKADSIQTPYNLQVVIAFYLTQASICYIPSSHDHAYAHHLNTDQPDKLAIFLAYNLAHTHDLTHALDRNHDVILAVVRIHEIGLDLELGLALAFIPDLASAIAYAYQLNSQLLIDQLTDLQSQLDPIRGLPLNQKEEWWKNEGQNWIQSLRAVMIEHRNIGHDWQFSEQQKALLRKYNDANLRLAECLNTDCYLSREVRQDIEATMLRPIAQIEAYYAAKGKPYPPVPNP